MRFFVISGKQPVAVVFHDYKTGEYFCRSVSEAFQQSFEAACETTCCDFVRKGGSLIIQKFGAEDFRWMDLVLRKVCGFDWDVHKEGEVINAEDRIDDVVKKYLD